MAGTNTVENGKVPGHRPKGHVLDKSAFQLRSIVDRSLRFILLFFALTSIIVLFFIIYFLFKEAFPLITEIKMWDILSGDKWMPTYEPATYGALPLIVGTLLVTLGSMVIAIPLGLGCAIFISQIAHPKAKDFLKLAVEILAGIPSVVYGLFGLIILIQFLRVEFHSLTGSSMLAGSILLGIMALPTIISVSEDALSSITMDLKEASLAMGATNWQTISKIVIPASISGITAAVILGMGRAMGETMAVMMVTGNTAIIPDPLFNIFSTVKTLTGTIGIEMGEASGMHTSALFFLGVILFIIVSIINISAINIMTSIRKRHLGLVRKGRYNIGNLAILKTQAFSVGSRVVKVALQIAALLGSTYLISYWFRDFALFGLQDEVMGLLKIVSFIGTKDLYGYAIGISIMSVIVGVSLALRFLKPKPAQAVAYTVFSGAMVVAAGILIVIVYYIVSEGMHVISWDFIISSPDYDENYHLVGGIWPAIVGTFYLVMGAILLAMPFGIGAGIYLSEYAKEGRLIRIIRLGIDNLNGTPSIVFGLFCLAFLVVGSTVFGTEIRTGRAIIAGIIILGIMVLPTIIRTTEESLKSVPHSIREGSLAMGSTKWETIWKVVFPPALPGIITGVILSIGRAAGETAPILFTATAFITPNVVDDLFKPTMALSTHIFVLANEEAGGMPMASGTALVLLIIIMVTYLAAALLRRYFKRKIKW